MSATISAYVFGSLGGWLILSCLLSSVPWRLKRPTPDIYRIRRLHTLPPVPPSRTRVTQADIFATWSMDLPVECLSDAEVALRAEQIEAAEDFNWLPGTWA